MLPGMHVLLSVRGSSTGRNTTARPYSTFGLAVVAAAVLCGCLSETSRDSDIRRDHEAISQILDAAVLSEHPASEFQKALPRVRAFPSVDSAWTDGIHFFVLYNNGGLVSWSAPLDPPGP